MNLSALSVRRGVAFTMVYLVVVLFGLFSLGRLQLDLFPEMNFPVVAVITNYTGAGPEDIETLASRPLEGALAGVEGVEEVASESRTGVSVVQASFGWDVDMEQAETDIRRQLDLYEGMLPDDADAPIVFAMDPAMMPVMMVAVRGPYPEDELRRLAEDTLQPQLERLPGVAMAVYQENQQEPGGTLEVGAQGFTIQAKGRYQSVDDIGEVVVAMAQREGGAHPVRLKDVATVVGAAPALLTVPTALRLRNLERAASRITSGDLEARANQGPKDAIGQLARSFYIMADRVEVLLDNQRYLVQAVAHEIRTPISRVRFGMEMAAMAEDEAILARRAAEVMSDLDELEELVGELLVFSRYDAGTAPLEPTSLAVRPAVAKLVKGAVPAEASVELTVDVAECSVLADPRSFNRAVRNVLLNAVRHSEHRIGLTITEVGAKVVVDIVDDGPGVPEADRERIFEPFGRTDQSRARASGGVGLGLAIVRRIMDAHEGTVELVPSEQGAHFRLTWPQG